MHVQLSCRWGDSPIRVSVRRTTTTTAVEAEALAAELSRALSVALPDMTVASAASMRRNQPATMVEVIPAIDPATASQPYWQIKLQAQELPDRLAIIERLEAVINEHVPVVDSLAMYEWIVRPITDQARELIPYIWLADHLRHDEAAAFLAELDRIRAPLLAPYIEGRYPVKDTFTFAAFHELPYAERLMIARMIAGRYCDANTIVYYLPYEQFGPLADQRHRQTIAEQLWPAFAQRLLDGRWAAPAKQGWPSSASPLLERAGRSKLLTAAQAWA